uniref:PPM-type phosphatase domain-containing protein n=1 Tax=Vannella robusta TaxID=1487602 RepID=A0A7S4I9M4_9EUKA|mmetsp:Transcript_2243/g.2748  ORF Transcript_2243/g.2748 Transcript_2243/m.2748 type:complete len:751 (+) Transcript_2243:34-2286(+)
MEVLCGASEIKLKYTHQTVGIISWQIEEGHRVKRGDVVVTVQLGEGDVPISSPRSGLIKTMLFNVGQEIRNGDIVAICCPAKSKKKYDTQPIINAIEELQKKRETIVGNLKDTIPAVAARCYPVDQEILKYRIQLLNLYKELKQRESERFDPEYQPFLVTTEMADNYCKYVPKLPLDRRACSKPTISISFVTEIDKTEKEHHLLSHFHGRSTSTYPFMEYKNQREGEPICDQYKVFLSPTNSLIAVADGCNWGRAPSIAAVKASKAFIDYMNKNRDLFKNTHRVARLSLEGLAAAHNAIISGPYEEGQRIGTTTLLGGLLSKVILPGHEDTPEEELDDWVFVFASIGDCKAFLWQSRNKRIEELTPDSRGENFLDASDCGGRIGPYIEGGPDTRNLEVFMAPCVTGDTIIVCSDGVHDNFDPQMHGLQPKDLNVDREQWEECTPSQANAAKAEWRVNEMKRVMDSDDPTVEEITEKFVDYCFEMNTPAQKFMQEFLGKRLPNDYTRFPGKMDHTTMVTIRVGEIPEAVILNRKKKILESRTTTDIGTARAKASKTGSLLKHVHGQGSGDGNVPRMLHQSSDITSVNIVRRTKSDSPRDGKKDEIIIQNLAIPKKNKMMKRNSSSILGLSASRIDIPDEVVQRVWRLFRKLTRELRQITVIVSAPASDSFPVGTLQESVENLQANTKRLIECIEPYGFDNNIDTLNSTITKLVEYLRENISDQEMTKKEVFEDLRRLLLMEFKIIRELASD